MPVALRRRRDAVAAVPVVVVVEVGLHDQLLALVARVGLGQADRLDDLAELALVLVGAGLDVRVGQQAVADELLGDRGTAAVVALEGVDGGRGEADGVEAGVLPERLVLDRGRRIDELGRDVLVRDELAAVRAEAREEHLPGAVVYARLLVVDDGLEGLGRVGEVLGEERVPGDDRGRTEESGKEDGPEEEDCDGCDRVAACSTSARATAGGNSPTLPPGEAGLHVWRDDTMRGMDARLMRRAGPSTVPVGSL